ncbi:MAG: glycosyltransferase family 4 protein [Oscillospiraceae bacterium]|nr:glycosyltransferase family 4 protein [Oscillospiraceae bacterium]
MNVLNVFYTFNSGGVERLGIDVSNQLAHSGNSAHLCVISDSYSQGLLDQLSDDVHLHLLKKKGKIRKLGYLKQLISIIDSEKIEAMHVHQGVLMSFYLLIKLLRPKLRVYFTVHDTYIFSELPKKDRLLSRVVCKKLIAISDAVVEDILKNGVSKDKIVRIYNGVDFSRFPVQSRNRDKERPVTIANVARFFPNKKGQDILIKATSILKNKGVSVRVIFAGGEVSESIGEMDRMKELAKTLGVSEEITFLGDTKDVPAVLNQADIFCIPSRYEGFGISAVEGMASGLPCVASNIIGLNEVVNSSKLGELFEAGNENDLADKILYVINHIDDYNGEEIAKNVRDRFSIEHMGNELLNTYKN